MNTQSEVKLSQAYKNLKEGKFEDAWKILQDAWSFDLDNKEIQAAIKCINFWKDRLAKAEQYQDPYEKGESLLSQWKAFTRFMDKDGQYFERSMYAVRQGIFSLALKYYNETLSSKAAQQRNVQIGPDLYRKAGLCYKKLGDYENALKFLESACQLCPNSATIFAEMADCYALCGNERTAKVFFREAFFVDAQSVDLSLLDSELICYLVKQTAENGFTGVLLQEWIPVYGVLFGVFNVKRELGAIEIGKLKQKIYSLEVSIHQRGNDVQVLMPQLINHYFWLIDHYITVGEDRARINEILLKLKVLNPSIYEKYTM
ncbi:MAG: tetratricopeptide repeat protein [Treponemataceae bacterium]|nr:tetratricopeptide repeat protein [Treponemataceae bacterium]